MGITLVITLVFAPLGAACAQNRAIATPDLRSGFEFLGADLKKMQQDDFANPGTLWVDRGEKLWRAAAGTDRKSCADCHDDARTSMKGVAVRYPQIDRSTGRLFSLETRILQSRVERQKAPAFSRESEDLLALNAYITHQSRGMPVEATIEGAARKNFDAGEAFFLRRRGQLNLSCAHCHDANWGRTLFAERISQGHPNAYPAYRLEWQTLGSLERRFRACLSGVRAEILPYGSSEYTDLSLYLSWRARGLPLETPGVRR
ncbi:MAG: sulfur oxidation c-type cytochrome SoxA [Betaproteobacteria bacterium]|nr:sulfur oxidation c-type cytochrome SoxA [Betaproteobacteria bacterium]